MTRSSAAGLRSLSALGWNARCLQCPRLFQRPAVRHTRAQHHDASQLMKLLPSMQDLGLRRDDHVHVAMSGGVDSSVVLAILATMPLNLHVVFMRNWDPQLSEFPDFDAHGEEVLDLSYGASAAKSGSGKHQCEWERDWEDVRRVTDHLSVPRERVRLVDFTKEYWSKVFEPAIGVWQQGATPNPDVDCNREIKFGSLMDSIPADAGDGAGIDGVGLGLGARHLLATGHYARVQHSSDPVSSTARLVRAADTTKDQTYYLSQVTAAQLARSVFPLGVLRKEDVRRLARHFRLPTAERAESMGVCFIGERGKFGDFISQYTSPSDTVGHLVTPSGERVGEHRGLWYYTIGQGAKIPGMQSKWFVAKKGVGKGGNDVLVVPGSDHPLLQCTQATTLPFHWIAGTPPKDLEHLDEIQVQLRHRMAPVPASIKLGPDDQSIVASFDSPITGVSPGQVLAVYKVTPLVLLNALKVSFFNPFRRAQKEDAGGQIVVHVKWGREKYNIPIPNPSTTPLSQLQATLSAQTDIPLNRLKLIHKGAVLKDASLTISSYGIKDGANLVLIGKDGDVVPNAPPPQSSGGGGGGKKKAKQPTTDSEQVLVDWINHSLVQATLDPLQASIATFLSYLRKPTEGEDVNVNRPRQIPKFEVLQREHARLSELLLRGLLDLDSVDIPDGWADARKARKEGVKRVQGELTKVDEAWGDRDKLGG